MLTKTKNRKIKVNAVTIDYVTLRQAVLLIRALNNQLRLHILDILEAFGTLNVTDLYVKLRTDQSKMSQELAVLRRANLVHYEREGKSIYYSVNKERLLQYKAFYNYFGGLEACARVLRALSHPLRMKILKYIRKKDIINVNNIYNTLKLEQSITSQHLKILRETSIVGAGRDGKYIYYDINERYLKDCIQRIKKFVNT